MNRKAIVSLAVTAAVVVLSGCNSTSSVKTGTGQYIDSFVEGIKYQCGGQIDFTDKNGTFTFEEGQPCHFSLAGIPLRTVEADELKDKVVIVEDNLSAAMLLQSLDVDGNLSNGIKITKEITKKVEKILEDIDPKRVLSDRGMIADIVGSVGADIESLSGELRSEAEVKAHLDETKRALHLEDGKERPADMLPTPPKDSEDNGDSIAVPDDQDDAERGTVKPDNTLPTQPDESEEDTDGDKITAPDENGVDAATNDDPDNSNNGKVENDPVDSDDEGAGIATNDDPDNDTEGDGNGDAIAL